MTSLLSKQMHSPYGASTPVWGGGRPSPHTFACLAEFTCHRGLYAGVPWILFHVVNIFWRSGARSHRGGLHLAHHRETQHSVLFLWPFPLPHFCCCYVLRLLWKLGPSTRGPGDGFTVLNSGREYLGPKKEVAKVWAS